MLLAASVKYVIATTAENSPKFRSKILPPSPGGGYRFASRMVHTPHPVKRSEKVRKRGSQTIVGSRPQPIAGRAIQAGVFVAGEELRLTAHHSQKNPSPELLAKGEKQTAEVVARMACQNGQPRKVYPSALQRLSMILHSAVGLKERPPRSKLASVPYMTEISGP
jgi:hypothetical protein